MYCGMGRVLPHYKPVVTSFADPTPTTPLSQKRLQTVTWRGLQYSGTPQMCQHIGQKTENG